MLRSEGAGGGRLPPATRWVLSNERPSRDHLVWAERRTQGTVVPMHVLVIGDLFWPNGRAAKQPLNATSFAYPTRLTSQPSNTANPLPSRLAFTSAVSGGMSAPLMYASISLLRPR
jgi:hypothetical protein